MNYGGTAVGQFRGLDTTHLGITNPAGSTSHLTVDTSSGKVGIGTTLPTYRMHIKSTASENTYFFAENTTVANAGIKLKNSQGEWTIIANDRLRIIDDDASGTERMCINSSGNVGIGTTAPDAKLHVAGQVKITGGSPGADKVLTSDANGLATWTDPSGGGHTIQNEGSNVSSSRDNLNFVGELVEAADDGSDSTDVTIDAKTVWLYAA